MSAANERSEPQEAWLLKFWAGCCLGAPPVVLVAKQVVLFGSVAAAGARKGVVAKRVAYTVTKGAKERLIGELIAEPSLHACSEQRVLR
eukprot:10833826-Karenia_brevis.AAC.1